jgi:hypothetical protein
MLPEEPKPELVLKRLETLRNHRWSSYPAYAGYAERPKWLYCEELWLHGNEKSADPQKDYREWIENYIKQGVEEKTFAKIAGALIIGSAQFMARLRKNVLKDRGVNSNERKWRRLLPFDDVVNAVEQVKGVPWNDFENLYGDWGRDLALYIGRVRCGLTLRELGEQVGLKMQTVSKAVSRIGKRLRHDKELQIAYGHVLKLLNKKEG